MPVRDQQGRPLHVKVRRKRKPSRPAAGPPRPGTTPTESSQPGYAPPKSKARQRQRQQAAQHRRRERRQQRTQQQAASFGGPGSIYEGASKPKSKQGRRLQREEARRARVHSGPVALSSPKNIGQKKRTPVPTKSQRKHSYVNLGPLGKWRDDELALTVATLPIGGPVGLGIKQGVKLGVRAGIKEIGEHGVKQAAKRGAKAAGKRGVARVKSAPARAGKELTAGGVRSLKAGAKRGIQGAAVGGLATGKLTPEEAATWALAPGSLGIAGKVSRGARAGAKAVGRKAGKAAVKKPAVRKLAGERGSMRLAGTAGPRTHSQRRKIRVAKTAAIGAGLASEPHSRLFIKRHAEATADDPLKVAGTTLRSIPSIVTAPAALAVAGGISGGRALTGHEKAGEPLKATGQSFIDFNKKLASLGSKGTSEKEARKIIQTETGLTGPLMAAPIAARGIRTRRAGEKAPTSRETGKIGRVAGLRVARRSKERREVARTLSKERTRSQAEQRRHAQETAHPTKMGPELSVAAVVAEHGSYGKAKEHAARQPRVEDATEPTIHDVIDYADANPAVFESRAYQEGLAGYRAGKGRQHQEERAKYAQVVLASGRPGTEARAAASKTTQKKARQEAERERHKARQELMKARVAVELERGVDKRGRLKPKPKGAISRTEVRYERAKQRRAAANEQLKQVKTARKTPRQMRREAKQEFVAEGKDIVAKEGLDEPVIMRHTNVNKVDVTPVDSGTRMTQTSRAIHGRRTDEGGAAAQGAVSYSPEAVMESLNVPSRVSAIHRATAATALDAQLPIAARRREPGKRKAKYRKKGDPEEATVGTVEDARENVGEGKRYHPDEVRIVPMRMFGWAVRDKNAKLLDDAVELSRRDANDVLNELQGTGERVMVMQRHKWDELVNGVTRRSKGAQRGQGVSRTISKGILYTPAWALAQVLAAGAVGRAHVPFNKQARGKRALAQSSPETQDVFGAEAGRVPGGAGTTYERLTTKPEVAGKVIGPMRQKWDDLDRTRAGRNAKRIIDHPSAFNKWSEGAIREGVLAGHALKEVKGVTSSMGEVARMHADFHKAMQGKTDAQVLEALARHPEVMRTISRKTEKMMGDFATLTHREQAVAPFLIFYPFMRYSAKFVTHGLPAAHPLKAAMFYDFAQWNADELKKFLGNDPPFFADWAGILVRTKKGDEGVKGVASASRITPGGGYVAESLGEVANLDKGWPALRALNPVAAALIALGTNVDPLTGKQGKTDTGDPETGGTVAAAKLAGSVALGSLSPARATAFFASLDRKNLLTQKDRTALVALNEKLRPSKPLGAAQRFLAPGNWQSGNQARDLAAVGAAFKLMGKSDKPSKDKGRALLDSLFAKHGLGAQNKRERDEFFAKKYGKKKSSPWSTTSTTSPWD